MSKYSRLESTEEKRNFKSAVILISLAVIGIIGLIFFGLPLVGRVASFVSSLKDGSSPIANNDKTPPAPPNLNSMVEYTNQEYVTVGGTAESGATLKLTFNGEVKESLIDKEGRFTFADLKLKEGKNEIVAVAVDPAGNVSNKSTTRSITFDVKPPEISIENPQDGSKFFGSTQRQINIKGKTESGSDVTINDRIVSIDDSGNFNYPITLNSGDNPLIIKAKDPAGNSSEKTITLSFSE